MKEFALHFLSQKRDWTSSMLTGCGPRQVLSSRKCELCFLAHSVCESFMHLLCVNHFRLLWALKCILHNSHNTSVLHMSIKGNSVSNHQIYKSSNHQIIKSSNHQIIKSSNHQIIKSSNHQINISSTCWQTSKHVRLWASLFPFVPKWTIIRHHSHIILQLTYITFAHQITSYEHLLCRSLFPPNDFSMFPQNE